MAKKPVAKKTKKAVAKKQAAKPEKRAKASKAKPSPKVAPRSVEKCDECKQPIMHHLSTCPVVNATPKEVERYTKAQAKAQEEARVCKDFSSHVCIELRRRVPESGGTALGKMVDYLALDGEGPYVVKSLTAREFDKTYTEVLGYPVTRCAKLFAGYMQYRGATERAVEELSQLINLSDKERALGMAKKESIAAAAKTGKKGADEQKAAMKAAKNGAAKAAKAPAKEKGERRSAASVAKELIMSGKLTDDKIFDQVHKEFPTFKRNYVAWYRNDLKKKGEKPPAKKEA